MTITPDPHPVLAYLDQIIGDFERMGHPALLERFVRRNGVIHTPAPRPKGVRKQANKMCFRNASHFVTNDPDGHSYVEGFALSEFGFPVHHAWVVNGTDTAIDVTWKRPEKCHYFGVVFDIGTLHRELVKHRIYGLLNHGFQINHDLMFEIDPDLKGIVDGVLAKGMDPELKRVMDQMESAA